MRKLLKPELFHGKIEAKSELDVIKLMCLKMQENNYVGNNFLHDVLKREALSSTAFPIGFALPHPIELIAKSSCISVATLKSPVLWGEHKVSLVFLLTIKKEDREILKHFFNCIDKVIFNPNRFARIIDSNNFNEFMDNLFAMI